MNIARTDERCDCQMSSFEQIRDVLLSVFLGVFGGVLLKAFYSMVRVKAPTAYAYAGSHLQRVARTAITGYALFRFAPVYFVSLAVCVTVERVGLYVLPALISSTVLFIIVSSVTSVYKRWKAPGKGAQFHAVLQLFSGLLTVAIALLAYCSYPSVSFLVPDPNEFVIAIWTAVFVAVVTQLFAGIASEVAGDFDVIQVVNLVKKDVGVETWEWIRRECRKSCVPWCVVAAIVVVEVNERPAWMRLAERICAYATLQRITMSFGVTQESSKRVLTDKDSVRVTIRWVADNLSESAKQYLLCEKDIRHLDERQRLRFLDGVDKANSEVKALAGTRNPDGRYGDMVGKVSKALYHGFV